MNSEYIEYYIAMHKFLNQGYPTTNSIEMVFDMEMECIWDTFSPEEKATIADTLDLKLHDGQLYK